MPHLHRVRSGELVVPLEHEGWQHLHARLDSPLGGLTGLYAHNGLTGLHAHTLDGLAGLYAHTLGGELTHLQACKPRGGSQQQWHEEP